uniref:asparagine--tRNA ligase n=1 Tax=Eutreptiella gymnastica TaxID=73025 RepID=A0A7S4GAY4_9EUGL
MDEQFSASKLLYSVATKAHTEAHRDLLGQYVKDEKIATSQQLECALAFLKGHPEVASGDAAFEKDCGVGVTVMDEEIAAAVAKAFEEDKAAIEEDRYQYNFGSMLGRLTKTDHIKWANPTKVKAELDKQTLAVLGPKTEADAQAGKKKKEKAKPAAKTEKVKKPSAAEVAMQKEAEQMAKMTEAAKAAMSTFLYKPRLCRIKQLLDDASKGVFPDENQECVVAGWIRTTRDQRAMVFVELNDGSGPTGLQIVLEPTNCPDLEEFKKLGAGYGACIEVTGKVVKSPAAGQLVEMQGTGVKLLGPVGDGYPLAKTALPLEVLRSYPHLRVRTNVMACVMRIRNVSSFAIHKFFQERHFQYVHTPILTSNDCEGAGECFTVSTLMGQADPDYSQDFFGAKSMLTVSGQLNVETYAAGLTNVYTFGPTFRAENSNTTRHLAEFWMVEPEVWFIDQKGLMDLAEDFLKYCISHVLKECQADLLYLDQYHQRAEEERPKDDDSRRNEGSLVERLMQIVSQPFGRVTYTEAIEILKKELQEGKATFVESNLQWGMDMASEHERYLAEQVFKKPVIVTDYPAEIKSFYMKQSECGKTVAGMDILVPTIGEIIGGSVREDNFDKLVALAKSKGMTDKDVESLSWYTDLRKYGSAPHGGFGLGFERLLLLCTGMLNIRDVIPFPRYPGNISC